MSVLRETATIDWGNSLQFRVTGFWEKAFCRVVGR
jgi:hypothetical protein